MVNTIKSKTLLKAVERAARLLQEIVPSEIVVLAHADHDGFTASAIFDSYLFKKHGIKVKIEYPSKTQPYHLILGRLLKKRPSCLLILDALIGHHWKLLEKFVKQGTLVINMDHHDLVKISHKNYVDLNPHNWGIEYLNSSGLIWLVLRRLDRDFFEKRAWVAGVGATQDICFNDNKQLFEIIYSQGLIHDISYEALFDSKLMKIAKMINAACNEGKQEYAYARILEATKNNSLKLLLEDKKLLEAYNRYIKGFNCIYNDFRRKCEVYQNIKLIVYEFTEDMKVSSISEICERDRRPLIFFGYHQGLLGFSSLFYDFDVRLLAKIFKGNGPHPKIAGARTKKRFQETVKEIYQFLWQKKTQKLLDAFQLNCSKVNPKNLNIE